MQLTLQQVEAFVSLPLRSLRHEYPNHIMHTLNGPEDVQSPRELHPVFYGCYDWHSAVHGYWLLARCSRLYPELSTQDEISELFNQHFTDANMQVETAYFQAPNRSAFERPYGWAWLLALAQELDLWDHPKAKVWLATMQPLVDDIRQRILRYFPLLSYAIRVGTHFNSAFALKLILDFARHHDDSELENSVISSANRYFVADKDYPAHYEPGGDEFISGAMTEALLMASVLSNNEFANWFASYLPELAGIKRLMEPAEVSDRSDPKIAHLDGLNLSRAWCMKNIALRLRDEGKTAEILTAAAQRHIEASLPHVASGEYAGDHWLATFAMLALEEPAGLN